jgi:hypothetical protein
LDELRHQESTFMNGTRYSAFQGHQMPGSVLQTLDGFARPDIPVRALTGATHPRFG